MSVGTLPIRPPIPTGTGLLVLCAGCSKEFRSSELQGMRCLDCRVHHACTDDRAAIVAYIKKQQRYAAAGAIANQKQFVRLQRRLFSRVAGLVADAAACPRIFDREYQSAVKDTPLNRLLADRDEALTLHPTLRQMQVMRDKRLLA